MVLPTGVVLSGTALTVLLDVELSSTVLLGAVLSGQVLVDMHTSVFGNLTTCTCTCMYLTHRINNNYTCTFFLQS